MINLTKVEIFDNNSIVSFFYIKSAYIKKSRNAAFNISKSVLKLFKNASLIFFPYRNICKYPE